LICFNLNISFLNFRHSQLRPQFQQPLSAELLSQQQFIKQHQQLQQQQQQSLTMHQQQLQNAPTTATTNLITSNSPKRDTPTRHNLLSQSIIHQSYGVSTSQSPNSMNSNSRQTSRSLPPQPVGCMQMSYYTQSQPPPQSYFGEILHPLQVREHSLMT
jgi:hypothetical protein